MAAVTFKAARVNCDLTQEEAAKRLGISKQMLCRYETGKTEPKLSMFKKMCNLYGVNMDDIFLP